MGWIYMTSLRGHAGPREYLNAQVTFEGADGSARVLRSALVAMRTYYAAVELTRPGAERKVHAVICLVYYNPRDRDGYVFGYKDMDEAMGPHEADCPAEILDLLTPTDAPYAVEWRARCRANIEARKAMVAKPKPKPGQTIVFEAPIAFANGRSFDRLEVVANPRSHRTVLFRDPVHGGLYRIPNVKARAYRLIDQETG